MKKLILIIIFALMIVQLAAAPFVQQVSSRQSIFDRLGLRGVNQ